MAIFRTAEELIGNTPMFLLQENGKELLIKLEGQNPGGSVKDRAAKAMIDDAEKSGALPEHGVIIEPTSGNTGIGLAMVGVPKGYRVIIVMPDSMSVERRKLLSAFGAELVLTDGQYGMQGAVNKALELAGQIEGAFLPMQFENPSNPDIHEQTTAREIIRDTNGEFDLFVAGIGTGGTFTGIARLLKREYPHILRVAVEPAASPLLSGGTASSHRIQGIGANFIPGNIDMSLVDRIQTVTDGEAFEAAKQLGEKHGLFVGISTGAAVAAARKLLEETGKKRAVCISPDRGEKYLSLL